MWVRKKSSKYNKYYYYNEETKQSIWDKPKTDYRIFHILIKHKNSRNPINDIPEDQAMLICEEIKNELNKSNNVFETFKQIAFDKSNCSSAKRHGDLGYLVKDEMYKEFENACFALERNSFSDVVKTPSGYHLIFRY